MESKDTNPCLKILYNDHFSEQSKVRLHHIFNVFIHVIYLLSTRRRRTTISRFSRQYKSTRIFLKCVY